MGKNNFIVQHIIRITTNWIFTLFKIHSIFTFGQPYQMLRQRYRFHQVTHEAKRSMQLADFYKGRWKLRCHTVVVVQLLSHVRLLVTPWTAAHQNSLSFTISWSVLIFMSIESVMPSNHFILCHPLLLLPSIFPSIRIICNDSAFHIRWPKYWSFRFSVSPSNEYTKLIIFRIHWFYLLAVQETLKSLLQHCSLKASILWCSAFFMISHPYMTPGQTITLTIWTIVSKVMSLLFNTLSKFVISFLPRCKHLLILCLQSLFTVILKPKKVKSETVSIVSPSICHEMMGVDAMILVFWMLNFKTAFSLSSFTFIKRLLSSSSLSAIKVISSACMRLLVFLPAILIPACESFSIAFRMMDSAYKLHKQGGKL